MILEDNLEVQEVQEVQRLMNKDCKAGKTTVYKVDKGYKYFLIECTLATYLLYLLLTN